MARYQVLMEHWRQEAPPVTFSAAAWIGWKPETPIAAELIEGPDDLLNYLAAFPGGRVG